MKYNFKLKEITMGAHGCFVEAYPYSKDGRWSINYSSILSDLICKAGRYCKHYASDLFIEWESIKNCLDDPNYEGETYLFGFREMGVDHDAWIQCELDDAWIQCELDDPWKTARQAIKYNYYEIMMLVIEADRETNSITMKYGPAVLVKEGE